MKRTRRSVLQAGLGVVTTGAVAGCLGRGSGASDDVRGYASFFALWDWARHVGDDQFPFETPVEVGQMGHGWNPGGDITREIAAAELFFYLDTPEFSWAQDVAAELERDYDDVRVIDGLAGIESHLIPFDGEEESDFYDPHVWVDPVLAGLIADKLGTELQAIDSDNAEAYAANADAYIEQLGDVDRQFENLMATAERDVAVLAGHDSFRYLEHRYGFDLRTPTGVTPDAAESFDDISDLIDVIDDHDIETILYDPFEAPDPDSDLPQMVDVVFEHTAVQDAKPLTPLEGTTAEWQENGWGWIEQMTEINLPSLRAALGA